MLGAMQTHRPLGRWPYATRAQFRKRAWIALIASLAWLALGTIAFGYWQLGEEGAIAWGEAALAALLAALAFWVVAGILFGILRWIVTGYGPRA